MALIVFDLDGTLVDSSVDLANSTNEVLESYGAAPLPVAQIASMVGDGARMLVKRARDTSGLRVPLDEALDRFRAVYGRRLLDHTRPYPGIADVVRGAAPHATLAVLTNKPEEPTRRLLDAFDLAPSFAWVIGGDSGFARKPDPAAFHELIRRAGVTPAAALMIGDSFIDVETGRRAGVRVCLARYGFGRLRGEPTLVPGDFAADTPADAGVAIARFLEGG
jgi:phosphoglycolate phosphatase